MLTITGGVFLVTFALKMVASNLVIGLLAAIPPLAQLIQIPSVYLVEKYRSTPPPRQSPHSEEVLFLIGACV